MTTTPSTLWAEKYPHTELQRWWSPADRSRDGYNVVYERDGEEQKKDWDGLDSIATGGTANVFRVDLSQYGSPKVAVAMKRFHTGRGNQRKSTRATMNQETNAIRSLHHIHIIEIKGSFEDPQHIGFFMLPWAEHTLESYMYNISAGTGNFGTLEHDQKYHTVQYLVSTMGCSAHALMYIHGKGWKHKDIKPANILIDKGRVLLSDFGISSALLILKANREQCDTAQHCMI